MHNTTPDYIIENHGTLCVVYAQTEDALKNLQDNVWGRNGLVVEPRYVGPLVEQLREEGWVVK